MTIPRITSRMPLRDSSLHTHKPSQSQSYSSTLMAVIQPRKHRHRTTCLALLILISLAAYVFLFQQSAFSPSLPLRRAEVPAGAHHMTLALQSLRNKHGRGAHRRPKFFKDSPLVLDKSQELAAVSSFIASLPQNSLLDITDPNVPIDPQLVLDFDIQSPRAADEVQRMMEDVWRSNPVFLYCKKFSPVCRELRATLDGLHLLPAPVIVDMDTRDDSHIIEPLVNRLAHEFPVLLVGGESAGSVDEIRSLIEDKSLHTLIENAGGVIDAAKKKHHKK